MSIALKQGGPQDRDTSTLSLPEEVQIQAVLTRREELLPKEVSGLCSPVKATFTVLPANEGKRSSGSIERQKTKPHTVEELDEQIEALGCVISRLTDREYKNQKQCEKHGQYLQAEQAKQKVVALRALIRKQEQADI